MTSKSKQRLDLFLVENGYFESREKAATSILAGSVYVQGEKALKPSQKVSADISIHIKERPRFVSRGGEKLAAAFKEWPLSCKNKIVVDLGASTGGFTDCMLKNGAQKVYAVDVGYGQLDYRLRQEPKVVCMEKVNARYLSAKDFFEEISFLTGDLSFISLKKVLPAIHSILTAMGTAILLIKPQFEAKPKEVQKGGVVRDETVIERILEEIKTEAQKIGFQTHAIIPSPLKGPAGNQEYLIWLTKS